MFLFQYDHKRVSLLADRLVTKIMSEIPDVVMNGDPVQRYPGIHLSLLQNHFLNWTSKVFLLLKIHLYKDL